MLNKKIWRVVSSLLVFCVGVLISLSCAGIATHVVPSLRQSAELAHCGQEANDNLVVECIFRGIESELQNHGVTAATEIFARAYRQYPAFVRQACHVQAHRLGDLTYYRVYVGMEELDAIELPQATTACGYGFFHGFLEHLIQDHPDPAFITKTCDYLIGRLGKDMGEIEMTCYHGSGHGLMLAQSERVPKSQWGNVEAFTALPLSQCESLAKANARDIEQCKEGIFNVLDEWASIGQQGFVLNTAQPFLLCATVPEPSLKACYYEMAMKSDRTSEYNAQNLARVVKEQVPARYREIAFEVGIAGIVQNVITTPGAYQDLLTQCTTLETGLYQPCVGSVINGLYEHGEPQEEYKKALAVCSDSSIREDQEEFCYKTVARRLERFYTPERVVEICKEFPDAYQNQCTSLNQPFISPELSANK